jgi:hypothetical protein
MKAKLSTRFDLTGKVAWVVGGGGYLRILSCLALPAKVKSDNGIGRKFRENNFNCECLTGKTNDESIN